MDFDTTPITLDFPVGRTRELTGRVPINNDNINEALEFFMAIHSLGFATEVSRPDLVTIRSDVIHLDIVDDDGECMCVYMYIVKTSVYIVAGISIKELT